jgi:hypothetical protein
MGWDRMRGEDCHERMGWDRRRGEKCHERMGWEERSVMGGWGRMG